MSRLSKIKLLVVALTISATIIGYGTITNWGFAAETPTHHGHPDTSMQVYGDADDQTPREDKAEVVIQGPDKVKVGTLITLDLSGSLGGGFDYEVEPKPPGLRTFDDGRIIVCGTGAKDVTYTFMVSCALGGDSDIAIHKVRVTGGQANGPPPKPGEDLQAKVLDWIEDVESPSKRDDAMKLAQSFSSIAIIIDQDTFTTPVEIIQATATSNRDALGTRVQAWAPLLDSLMLELRAMAQDGKLSDVKSHAFVWKEVAQALRDYARTAE